MSNELTTEEKEKAHALSLLSERELQAYKYSVKNNQPALSSILADELYELFKQGRTCEEIRKSKPGLAYGAIVQARVKDLWDKRRQEHQTSLIQTVPQTVQQTQMESAGFIAKLLMASNKLMEGQIDAFLATGDKAHLKDTFLETLSIKQYRDLLATLAEATGQNQKKTVNHNVTFTPQKAPTAAEAHSILDAVVIEKK